MDIAQLVDQVGSIVGDSKVIEALGEDNAVKIKSTLRQITSEGADMKQHIQDVNTESKGRKIKIRDELTPEIESLKDKVKELEENGNMEELESELKGLREFKSNTVKVQRDSFSKNFGDIAEHPNFSKAKNFFNLPLADSEGKFVTDDDGNFDFSKVDEAGMETNILKLGEFSSVGLFENADNGNENTNKGEQSQNGRQEPKNTVEEIKKITSMAELDKLIVD